MRVKFSYPGSGRNRAGNRRSRSVMRDVSVLPHKGSKVTIDSERSFTVDSVAFNLNVTSGTRRPGAVDVTVYLH